MNHYERKMYLYSIVHNTTAREYFSALKQATKTNLASKAIQTATDQDYKTALEILIKKDF